MDNPVKVLIHRRRDGVGEEVASFAYGDLAEVAARAICERYHYPVSVETEVEPEVYNVRYEWRSKKVDAVVKVPYKKERRDGAEMGDPEPGS